MTDSINAPAAQTLRCAGCGALGHAPIIVWDKRDQPPGVVLQPVFGFFDQADRPALLCAGCKAKLPTRRHSRRYRT
jgi:hypothetical protein